jgi:hypothetical protein
MKLDRSANKVSAAAMQVFAISLLGIGVLAIIYAMSNNPLASGAFDVALGLLTFLALVAVITYFVPYGFPAAMCVGILSLLMSVLAACFAVGLMRETGLHPSPWLNLAVAALSLACASRWVAKRTISAYRGALFEDQC